MAPLTRSIMFPVIRGGKRSEAPTAAISEKRLQEVFEVQVDYLRIVRKLYEDLGAQPGETRIFQVGRFKVTARPLGEPILERLPP